MYEVDTGIRCETHAGEVFPPRCEECAEAEEEFRRDHPAAKIYVPGSECELHSDYPMPCDRCERDARQMHQAHDEMEIR